MLPTIIDINEGHQPEYQTPRRLVCYSKSHFFRFSHLIWKQLNPKKSGKTPLSTYFTIKKPSQALGYEVTLDAQNGFFQCQLSSLRPVSFFTNQTKISWAFRASISANFNPPAVFLIGPT